MNKISCITITKNRVEHLVKCINYFIAQTHENKELIIVYYNTDTHTEKYLKAQKERLDENNIKIFKFIEDDGMYLGAIRNYAIMNATGDWICIWDDDDYFAENRIESQLNYCLEYDLEATALRSLIIFSDKYQEIKLSYERLEGWEGSLFVKREIMPRYKNLNKGEDTPVLLTLISDYNYKTQFEPELYIYIFHDSNISGNRHKQNILNNSYKLDIKKIRELKQKLNWL